MSALGWVSLPKLKISQLMEKMVNSLSRSAQTRGDLGFSGRMLSGRNGHLGETRRPAPVFAEAGIAFSQRHKPIHERKFF
ncbi:MAG: hypothetical protein WCY41_01875 [Candidatus Micrarchaeia archaeon]